MKLSFFAALIISILLWQPSFAVTLDSSIIPANLKVLKSDFNYLRNIRVTPASRLQQNILNIPVIDGKSLESWLDDRVKILLGIHFPTEQFLEPQIPNLNFSSSSLLTHWSAFLFSHASSEPTILFRLNLFDGSQIKITTPKTGVVQIHRSFFAKENQITTSPTDSNTISRLSFLFHEGRHSDGNGKNAGFIHVECPAGHDYEFQPRCDRHANGAYAVGSTVLNILSQQCSTCSDEHLFALKVLSRDFASRLLIKKTERETVLAKKIARLESMSPPWGGQSRNFKIKRLKRKLSTLQKKQFNKSFADTTAEEPL